MALRLTAGAATTRTGEQTVAQTGQKTPRPWTLKRRTGCGRYQQRRGGPFFFSYAEEKRRAREDTGNTGRTGV